MRDEDPSPWGAGSRPSRTLTSRPAPRSAVPVRENHEGVFLAGSHRRPGGMVRPAPSEMTERLGPCSAGSCQQGRRRESAIGACAGNRTRNPRRALIRRLRSFACSARRGSHFPCRTRNRGSLEIVPARRSDPPPHGSDRSRASTEGSGAASRVAQGESLTTFAATANSRTSNTR